MHLPPHTMGPHVVPLHTHAHVTLQVSHPASASHTSTLTCANHHHCYSTCIDGCLKYSNLFFLVFNHAALTATDNCHPHQHPIVLSAPATGKYFLSFSFSSLLQCWWSPPHTNDCVPVALLCANDHHDDDDNTPPPPTNNLTIYFL